MGMTERVVALDPGGTTGVVVWPGTFAEFDCQQATPFQIHTILETADPTVVIVERFDARNKVKLDLTPVEVIGTVKNWVYHCDHPIELVYQSPSYAKHFWTNEKLKALGLYKPGLPHAMDALRHMLAYLSKSDRTWLERLIDRKHQEKL